MPELLIKYTNPKVKEALTDFSKYLDFTIEKPVAKKVIKRSKPKDDTVLEQIEKGLREALLIRKGKMKGMTVKQLLNEK
jgi:hypothetical protein